MNNTDNIFVIKDTETLCFWKSGTKVAWATAAAAKNAWHRVEGQRDWSLEDDKPVYFDEQGRYTLVKLSCEVIFE